MYLLVGLFPNNVKQFESIQNMLYYFKKNYFYCFDTYFIYLEFSFSTLFAFFNFFDLKLLPG